MTLDKMCTCVNATLLQNRKYFQYSISPHYILSLGPALGGAEFEYPTAVTIDEAANVLYVAQWHGNIVRKINIDDGAVTTIVAAYVGLGAPLGILFDPLRFALYVPVSAFQFLPSPPCCC